MVVNCPLCSEMLLDNYAEVRGETSHCGQRIFFSPNGVYLINHDPNLIYNSNLSIDDKVNALGRLKRRLQNLTVAHRRDVERHSVEVDRLLRDAMDSQAEQFAQAKSVAAFSSDDLLALKLSVKLHAKKAGMERAKLRAMTDEDIINYAKTNGIN